MDNGLLAFLEERRNIFGIAYRILGSAAEAEDIVQDVWLRWQNTDRSKIFNPPAFLATITRRMCINLCRSARSRRETYVGSWLSDPIATNADPSLSTESEDALKTAVEVLLVKLRPTERAAYILREAFEYSSRQIADVLQMTETNVRQLLTRARKRIAEGHLGSARSTEQRVLLANMLDAVRNGNITALEGFLVSHIDRRSGGAKKRTRDEDTESRHERLFAKKALIWCHKTAGASVLKAAAPGCDEDLEGKALSRAKCKPAAFFTDCLVGLASG
jgi:RNA polymerase sigma-70 factor (ECF subfamily)